MHFRETGTRTKLYRYDKTSGKQQHIGSIFRYTDSLENIDSGIMGKLSSGEKLELKDYLDAKKVAALSDYYANLSNMLPVVLFDIRQAVRSIWDKDLAHLHSSLQELERLKDDLLKIKEAQLLEKK